MQPRDRLRHSFGEDRGEPGVPHGRERRLNGIDLEHDAGLGADRRKATFQQAAGRELGAKVRDVSELLALAGPKRGAPIGMEVAYDAPCHLEHAQGVRNPPLEMLAAIPELIVRRLPGSERCCGSAGIYSLLRPTMARAILAQKIEVIAQASPRPALIATGNPGCLMQIGAGLRQAGLKIDVVHPVQLLDRSYAAAGLYRSSQ